MWIRVLAFNLDMALLTGRRAVPFRLASINISLLAEGRAQNSSGRIGQPTLRHCADWTVYATFLEQIMIAGV